DRFVKVLDGLDKMRLPDNDVDVGGGLDDLDSLEFHGIALFASWLQDDKAVAVGLKGRATGASAAAADNAQLPPYFYRLSARAQRTYLKGNSIERFELVASARAFALTDDLMHALDFGAPSAVE